MNSSPEEAALHVGIYAQPWEAIFVIVNTSLAMQGTCTTPMRGDHESYAHWLVKVRG